MSKQTSISQASISLQIPTDLDRFYERLAKQRMTSKSAIIREVLAKNMSAMKTNVNANPKP